jgi:hypothetical protein
MRLVYADTIKDLLARCAIQDGKQLAHAQEGRWGQNTPCPGPTGGRRRGCPRDLCALVALDPSSLLGLMVSSRENVVLGPFAQPSGTMKMKYLCHKCISASRSHGVVR